MSAAQNPNNRVAGPLRSLARHRELITQLTHREIIGKYRGSFLGLLWSLLNPLLLLVVYTFVFTQVFKARWVEGESTAQFAIALFVGLIIHGFLAECISRAPLLVTANPSYVTKVVFPLEILPFPSVFAALFHAGVSTVVLLVAQLVISGHLPWTAVLFPMILLPLAAQILALSWILSGISVYVRDIAQFVTILVTGLLFLSPVFFPLHSLPVYLQGVARFNPLTIPIEESRKVLLWGQWPDFGLLGIYSVVSLVVFVIGFAVFQKVRRGFADVL
ncbi:MAG TPA: ABC transporter permease [Lysobacter sp.]|nr:ABC transporter permease [Lysobacter sp.]